MTALDRALLAIEAADQLAPKIHDLERLSAYDRGAWLELLELARAQATVHQAVELNRIGNIFERVAVCLEADHEEGRRTPRAAAWQGGRS